MSTDVECSKVVVKTNGRAVLPRTYSTIGGIALGERKLLVNGRSIHTLKASIVERVMYCRKNGVLMKPLKPEKDIFKTLIRFKTRLLGAFGEKPSRLSPEEFVDLYKGRRRTIYENALDDYYSGVKRIHARLRAFVKAEKVKEGSPRCIQPRSPVYNIGLGVYLKHIEHRLYTAIARVFRQPFVVSKGMNVVELGEGISKLWYSVSDPCYVGFDAVRFDMHVSVAALKWEHSIYKWLYDYDPELCRLLDMQLHNFGVGYCDDGKLKYDVHGRRMSGDMNTGLGNCLLMCAMVHAYIKSVGLRCKFINNGDDCGVVVSRRDLHLLSELPKFLAKFGFRVEVEKPVVDLERLEFCQMHPVFDGKGWRMLRKVTSALMKDTMSLIPFTTHKVLQKWVYSVGECGLALCGGIPVVQEAYAAMMRLGIPSKISDATYMECGARILARGLDAKYQPVTDEARYSFWVGTGILPSEQLGLEDYYTGIRGGCAIDDNEVNIQFPDPYDI